MDYDETTVLDLTKRGAQLGYKGVDVLLTNNWPKGILNDLGFVVQVQYMVPITCLYSVSGPGPVGVSMLEYDLVGMDVIGRIATALAPRYHVCSFAILLLIDNTCLYRNTSSLSVVLC
jgi:hypothetical protein